MEIFKVFLVALALIHLLILIGFGLYMSLRDLIELLKEDKKGARMNITNEAKDKSDKVFDKEEQLKAYKIFKETNFAEYDTKYGEKLGFFMAGYKFGFNSALKN